MIESELSKDLVVVKPIGFFSVFLMFVVYLITHYLIGVWKNKLDKKENKTEDDLKVIKFVNILFKWYPAIAIVIIIIILLQ